MKPEYLYRINGFDQIKSFYSWLFNNQDKEINTSHVSLYLFLINQNNRSNWVEWFKCPYDLGMAGSCIGSRNTYYKCLADLQQWGLIEYSKGTNNYKAPVIKLCLFKNEQQTEQVPIPLSEPLTEHLIVPLTEPLTEHIYKLLTNNLKLITDNLEIVVTFLNSSKLIEPKLINVHFEIFWNLYDKKIDRKKCEPKWVRLTDKERNECIEKLPAYIFATPDKKFRRDPETYLNNKSWENEIISPIPIKIETPKTYEEMLELTKNNPELWKRYKSFKKDGERKAIFIPITNDRT